MYKKDFMETGRVSEEDDAFNCQVELDETLYLELSLNKGIEPGLKGPQGNRTSFIPMGKLVSCPICSYEVNLRIKGQRCPHHNEQLVPRS